jgi:hypothetical protein
MEMSRDKTLTPPLKLREHKERIEQWNTLLERNFEDLGSVYDFQIKHATALKMRLDGMYIEWAEGVERTRWVDLPAKPDLSAEDIVRETVFSTEAVYGATGVEVLARYLEIMGYDGIFKRLVEAYMIEIRPILEEALPYAGDTMRILSDPRGFFGTDDDQEVRARATERFSDHVNRNSPQHVIRAMIAHVEFGLGNFVTALREAEYAHHEMFVPNFGQEIYKPNAGAAEDELIGVELRKAAILIDLLKQY